MPFAKAQSQCLYTVQCLGYTGGSVVVGTLEVTLSPSIPRYLPETMGLLVAYPGLSAAAGFG